MGLFMFGVFAVVLAFAAIVFRTTLRWRGAWRWLGFLPLLVFSVAVIDIVRNPSAHNLWPFELLVWVVLGFIILGVVAAARSHFVKKQTVGDISGN